MGSLTRLVKQVLHEKPIIKEASHPHWNNENIMVNIYKNLFLLSILCSLQHFSRVAKLDIIIFSKFVLCFMYVVLCVVAMHLTLLSLFQVVPLQLDNFPSTHVLFPAARTHHFVFAGGPIHVTFPSGLTLKEVQRKNPLVVRGGRYRPPHCEARHRTAIIIPHRHREHHLKFLLYYLHPFLQRQQLQYGIYIIHQVKKKMSIQHQLLENILHKLQCTQCDKSQS